jgi:hypothetical protein
MGTAAVPTLLRIVVSRVIRCYDCTRVDSGCCEVASVGIWEMRNTMEFCGGIFADLRSTSKGPAPHHPSSDGVQPFMSSFSLVLPCLTHSRVL